ncbi:DUF503 domain-containing protein [Dehalobacterium formicoaceticum]|uniref:DUF503 domain-containing protein n=1 Tax=Dehalobacterium formicoaceticum TaxID=51515 RepID=A0ABT1Y0M5_9FIRM|nr:DUF503 domain-containing protein [Dehalobacterium formicoaceticum]MCR6544103.1 DUF503 domain-containing protein [Dehalobacterium formicoaceticum]
MIIGTCIYDIHLYYSQSLKDKRRILKSIIDRVKNKFNVSIAEIDHQDSWDQAVLGIAVVSNQTTHANQMLNNVTRFLENTDNEFEITRVTMEII